MLTQKKGFRKTYLVLRPTNASMFLGLRVSLFRLLLLFGVLVAPAFVCFLLRRGFIEKPFYRQKHRNQPTGGCIKSEEIPLDNSKKEAAHHDK